MIRRALPAEAGRIKTKTAVDDHARTQEQSIKQDVTMGLGPGLGNPRGGVPRAGSIKIHGAEAFAGMRRAGLLAAETLDFITPHVRPGITTGELDRLCHGFIVDHDAIPAPLNYRC